MEFTIGNTQKLILTDFMHGRPHLQDFATSMSQQSRAVRIPVSSAPGIWKWNKIFRLGCGLTKAAPKPNG
jgi:hypothetical protein